MILISGATPHRLQVLASPNNNAVAENVQPYDRTPKNFLTHTQMNKYL